MTRIIISGHPLDRLRERGISKEEVEAVVRNPSSTWEDGCNQSRVLTGVTKDGRTLRVCLVHPPAVDGTARVKTAFYV